MGRYYYIYVLSSSSGVLYIGITNDLIRRVGEHKLLIKEKIKKYTTDSALNFTTKYNVDRLVYYEQSESAESAILREKQLKGWTRQKKVDLIKSINPRFEDLYNAVLG